MDVSGSVVMTRTTGAHAFALAVQESTTEALRTAMLPHVTTLMVIVQQRQESQRAMAALPRQNAMRADYPH